MNINESIKKALKWFAAEYFYLKELKKEIDKAEIKKDERLKDLKKAANIFRYVGRAEQRAARYEHILEEDLENLRNKLEISKLSSGEVKKIHDLVEQLQVHSNFLVKHVSFYQGKLKKEIGEAEIEVALEERKPGEKIE